MTSKTRSASLRQHVLNVDASSAASFPWSVPAVSATADMVEKWNGGKAMDAAETRRCLEFFR